LATAYFAIGYYSIGRFRLFTDSEIKICWIRVLYVLKVVAAVSVALIYTFYYKDRSAADIYKYFDDGTVIFSALRDNPLDYLRLMTGIDGSAPSLDKYYLATDYWFKIFDYRLFNDNRTIIRFNALLMLVSNAYFSVHVILMAFFSFCGTFALFRFIAPYTSAPRFILLVAVFLVPSFLFWTSGLLKEGLLTVGIGYLLYSLHKMRNKENPVAWLLVFLASLLLMLITKYYVIACLVPALVFFVVPVRTKQKQILTFLLIHIGMVLCVVANWYAKFGIDIIDTLVAKRNDYIHFAQSLDSVGSYIPMPLVDSNLYSFLAEIPQALYNVFILPLPWHVHSILSLLPAFENIALFMLVLILLVWPRRNGMELKMVLFSISFVVLLYTLSGLITPVLGSLVRYKTPAMPFLYSLLVALIDWRRVIGRRNIAWLEAIVCKA